MRWEDERYVKLFTRDTVEWRMLPWQSRALFPQLLRKVDRAGILETGRYGARGIAEVVGLPVEVVEPGLRGLLEDGCVVQNETRLIVRNFIEAQEATQSDAARAREYRARARDRAKGTATVTKCDDDITKRDETVTQRHAASRAVTPSLSEPSLTETDKNPRADVMGSESEPATPARPASPSGLVHILDSVLAESPEPQPCAQQLLAVQGPTYPARRQKAKSAELKVLLEHYCQRWLDVSKPADGKPPDVTKADVMAARRLLIRHGPEKAREYVDRFLDDETRFVAERGYVLRDIGQRLTAYRSQRTIPRRGPEEPRPAVAFTHEVKF